MRKILVIVLFLTPLIGYAAALMTGVVFIDIKLLDKPSYEGKVIANLAADAAITVEQRQGSWTKVTTAENTGWVPTLTIRIKSVIKQTDIEASTDEMKEKLDGENKTEVVATMGIRGLDEEELKQAKFNKKQLALLESYHANEQQISKFSQAGKLIPKKVVYLGEEQGNKPVEVLDLSE
jgi:dGTP triphosphohydrolase